MSTVVMIDGVLRSEQDASVSVFDRGFLYGDSVFETLRTYGGEPFALEEHLERLEWSAERVHITPPCDRACLMREVRELLHHARNEESLIRVMITRGVAPLGLDPELAGTATRVIIVAPLRAPPEQAYSAGVRVITYRTQRLADATDAAGAKIGNYLVAILAIREAKQRSAVEALIIDARDQVIEGTSSNLFAVVDGALLTPPEASGILPGITRGRVIALALGLKVRVEYRSLELSELLRADEVFISSTVREIFPVVSIDDRPIGSGTPGPITTRLLEMFRAHCASGGALSH
jgi:branched-chain amino acid aminotransferase